MSTSTASPIVRVLNRDVGRYHRWCTPSILPDQERVEDFYASDISISAGFFGTLVDHHRHLRGGRALRGRGAGGRPHHVLGARVERLELDRVRAVALERSDALELVARNINHSVIDALKAFGLDFRFLPTPNEPRFEALPPPSVEQVRDGARPLPGGARGALHTRARPTRALGLSRYGLSGYEGLVALVARGIVIEKAGVNTITLITAFRLAAEAVADTVAALEDVLGPSVLPGGAREPMAANPFSAMDDRAVIHPYAARRYAKSIGHELPLREAVGKVAAEHVEVYPPGIPVILEGFRVSADAVEYLLEAGDKGGSIVARDTSLETLRVL